MKDPKGLPMADEEGFRRVCEEDYAYMAPMFYVRSVSQPAKCAPVRLPTQYFQAHLAIALSKDSAYKNTINRK
jgi:hypothetical protein